MNEDFITAGHRKCGISLEHLLISKLQRLDSGSFQNPFKNCVGVSQPVVSKVLDGFVNFKTKMHRSSFICLGQDVKERKSFIMLARLTTYGDPTAENINIIRYFRPPFFLFSTR